MAGTRFDPVAHAKAMRDGGFWIDKNYDEFLQPTIARTPDKLALLAYRADRADGSRFTYAEIRRRCFPRRRVAEAARHRRAAT